MSLTIIHTTDQISNFLEIVIMQKLKAEIDAYVETMNAYGNSWEIITYNEIAMLSLFKSALLRDEKAKEVWAMQEYEVFDHDRPRGRADLFATIRKPELNCDLLIEAKWDGTYSPSATKDNDPDYWHHTLKEALTQGKEYYEYEKNYFIDNSFVITMFFGNYKIMHEEKYQEYRVPKVDTKLENEPYQFFIRPEKSPNTLCVYGQILKVR